jgi:peptidoglycan/xylan/chitin deacetylase (PgdA/CDA1 family)
MYNSTLLSGDKLPAGVLCLTFDDGPGETINAKTGPQTLKLAEYLNSEGIEATFFMVGRNAARFPGVLPDIHRLGHLIGNHSYHHPNLATLADNGGSLIDEIVHTDILIKPFVDGGTIYVRPPYGAWSPHVMKTLNASPETADAHFGPVGWDISARDWACWRDGIAPAECAERYYDRIQERGNGIILIHDSTADIEAVMRLNRAYELVKLLVPMLLRDGYSFIRLDKLVSQMKPRVEIPLTIQSGFDSAVSTPLLSGRT